MRSKGTLAESFKLIVPTQFFPELPTPGTDGILRGDPILVRPGVVVERIGAAGDGRSLVCSTSGVRGAPEWYAYVTDRNHVPIPW